MSVDGDGLKDEDIEEAISKATSTISQNNRRIDKIERLPGKIRLWAKNLKGIRV